MIVYDYLDPFSTLWWMHGSVLPHVMWLSSLCTLNGAISVYFKESYNYYMDHTPHMYMGTTIGILLILKAVLAYQHYTSATGTLRSFLDSIRLLSVRANAYGHCSGEENARNLVTGRVNMAKHICVLWYSLIFHLRKQRLIPKNSHLKLFLSDKELKMYEEADVRPLLVLLWIDRDIANLRDKGCMTDPVACMLSAEVTKLVEAFGVMERVKTYPTVPFAYYQFCNWAVFLFCFSVPASIASHNTDFATSSIFSFVVSFIYFGINFLGNDLQAPFGNGPNDVPMERYGLIIENELYQSFPVFRFRFESFALFQEGFVVYPPDDIRNIPPKAFEAPKKVSKWVPARIKIRAAMRLGNPRLRRFREAKAMREREVDQMVKERLVEEADMGALAKAIAAGGGGGGRLAGAKAKYNAAAAGLPGGPGGEGSSMHLNGDAKAANGDADAKPGGAAPAELLPESTIARQAGRLIKKHPESESLQKMLLQITNPRMPESDKQALLALMTVEVAELDGDEEDEDEY